MCINYRQLCNLNSKAVKAALSDLVEIELNRNVKGYRALLSTGGITREGVAFQADGSPGK